MSFWHQLTQVDLHEEMLNGLLYRCAFGILLWSVFRQIGALGQWS